MLVMSQLQHHPSRDVLRARSCFLAEVGMHLAGNEDRNRQHFGICDLHNAKDLTAMYSFQRQHTRIVSHLPAVRGRAVQRRGVPEQPRRDHHGQPQRARAHLHVVHADAQGLRGHAQGRRALPAQRPPPQGALPGLSAPDAAGVPAASRCCTMLLRSCSSLMSRDGSHA